MRRLAVLAVALPLLVAAAPASAAVRFDVGTTSVSVTEWNDSHHDVTTRLTGWWARPPARFHGKRPVVVLLHGSYATCTTPTGADAGDLLPCAPGSRTIDNARGLVYLVNALAKAGYVAISVDANVSYALDNHILYRDGFESTSSGAFSARALVVDGVLRKVARAAQTGTFAGRRLVGRVDLQHVGIVGHSRGGEGAIMGATDGTFSGGPYRLAALLALAPTNFQGLTLPDVPFATMVGYCDGDVFNLGGLAYYDATTRNPARVNPAYAQVVVGANHNFFDSVWAGDDEAFATPYCAHRAIGRTRLSARQQRSTTVRFARAFLRRHLSHGPESSLLATRGKVPGTIGGHLVTTAYQPGAARRRVIDVPASIETGINALGDAVTGRPLGALDLVPPDLARTPAAPWSPHRLVVRTLGSTGVLSETIPAAAGDVHGFRSLSFRAAIDPRVLPGTRRLLVITLVDTAGKHASVTLTSEAALRTPPASGGGRKAVLGTIRVSLGRFAIDRTHLARIDLALPGSGRVLIADVALER